MAWIRIIQEHDATGKLKEMYDKLIEPWGGADNIMTSYYAYVNRLADGLGVELET